MDSLDHPSTSTVQWSSKHEISSSYNENEQNPAIPRGMWVEKTQSEQNDNEEETSYIRYRCLWDTCYQSCYDIDSLEQHMSQHLTWFANALLKKGNSMNWVCFIRGCEIAVSSEDELGRHLKMHIFHAQKQYNGMVAVHNRFSDLVKLKKMEDNVDKKLHTRHCLLYEFKKGVKAAEAARNISAVYPEDVVDERIAQIWFNRFKEGDFDLNDTPRAGRPSELDKDALNALLQTRQTTRELAVELNCSHMTVARHLHSMGKVQKLGAWVPHVLTPNNKINRSTICASLLARHRFVRQQHHPFLKLIVTGDEKWCLYVDMKQRKEWLSPDKQADLAASDYHLFRLLSNNLRGVSFNNDAELRNWLDEYFEGLPADFFKRGIEKLVERWEEVVDNEGEYIID